MVLLLQPENIILHGAEISFNRSRWWLGAKVKLRCETGNRAAFARQIGPRAKRGTS